MPQLYEKSDPDKDEGTYTKNTFKGSVNRHGKSLLERD
jgi:hypothetical protein